MEAFKGKFVLVSAEQYDQFLKAIGVGFLLRKAIPCFTPEITITEVEGGLWKVKTSTIFKTFEIEFKLNEEFDETTPDGREVKSVVTVEDGILVWVETGKKEGVASTKTVGKMEEEDLLVFNSTLDRFPELVLDQNDPSKPSHRLTNGPEPSKTIESDGRKIKNHRKTIDGNGQTAKKHSMVMVSSKTIENLQWSLQNH